MTNSFPVHTLVSTPAPVRHRFAGLTAACRTLGRIVDAIADSRRRKASRVIAQYIARSDGQTGSLERGIERSSPAPGADGTLPLPCPGDRP